MLYHLKAVKESGKEKMYPPCTEYSATPSEEKIEIELTREKEIVGKIELPQDGEVVFVMNDKGDNVDSYRYPPKIVRKEFRA
jgi:hypothetical protein